jgi:hypothetical protein
VADDLYTDPMGAVVPTFTPDEDPNAVVPVPPVAEAEKPDRQRPLGETIRGSWRSNTLFGAGTESYAQGVVQGDPARRNRFREAVRSIEGDTTPYPDLSKELDEKKRLIAEQSIAEQIAYDKSDPYYSGTNFIGTVIGGAASPESFGGISGLIARKVPMLAGNALRQVIIRQGLDAAITNTATDPLVQGLRMRSGAQENYDVGQTAMAPVVGFAVGGALGATGKAAGPLFARMGKDVPPVSVFGETPSKGVPKPEATPRADAPVPIEQELADAGYSPSQITGMSEQQARDSLAARNILQKHAEARAASVEGDWRETKGAFDELDADLASGRIVLPENPPNLTVKQRGAYEPGALDRAEKESLAWAHSQGLSREELIQSLRNDLAEGRTSSELEDGTRIFTRDLLDYMEPSRGAPSSNDGERFTLVDPIGQTGKTLDVEVVRNPKGEIEALETGHGRVEVPKELREQPPEQVIAETLGERADPADVSAARTADAVVETPEPSRPLIENRSSLQDTASWVLRDKETKAVVTETFDPKKVAALNTEKYEAVPIQQYLGELNASIKDGAAPAASDLPLELARRGGGKRPPPLPNEMEMGRPRSDQGTAPGTQTLVQRVEDISKQLTEVFNTIATIGRTRGAQGTYNLKSGVVQVKKVSDIDTLAHEIGHQLHLGTRAKGDFDKIVQANKSELSRFGAGTSAENDAEAFANLFHAYVVNRPFAEKNFPNAVAHLDATLKSKFPDAVEQINAVREALDYLHRAPSGEVVSADTISAEPPKFGDKFRELASPDRDPFGRVVYSAMDSLYAQTIDINHPVYKAVEGLVDIAKGNGKDIHLKPLDDAYMLARRMPGAHARADTMLKYGVVQVGKVSPEGPSLSSGLEKALGRKWDEKAFHEFGAYLTARRMVAEYKRFFNGDLERPPGKYSFADYQKAVQEFEASNPAFRDGADDIYQFQQNHLKRLFDKGMVTKEFFQAASAREDYVPAQRDMRDFLDKAAEGTGVGKQAALLAKSVMKRFRGSDRSVINPLESIFKKVHDLEYAIARNDTMNAMANLAETAGPGSGFIYRDVPSNKLQPQQVDVIEALRLAGKQAGIDEVDLHHLIQQAEDVLGDSTWATLFKQKPIEPGQEPIVFRWVGGERRAGQLGDNRLGRELHHALTVMGDHEKSMMLSVMAMSSAMLRAGVTKSLDFMLVNPVRDQITATLTGGAKYIPFVSMVDGLHDAIAKSQPAIDFAAQGGLAGGAIVQAMENSQFGKNVKSLQGHGVWEKIWSAPEFTEAGTRVGLYKTYLKQATELGFDPENAAMYAAFKADDYIDFRKHGAAMGSMRRTMTFMNAALQGTDKELRAVGDLFVLEAKRGRGETLDARELARLSDARVSMVRLLTLGVIASGLAVLNANNDKVQNASPYNRAQNFLFSALGVDFAIPKGFGVVQSVTNLFERGTEYALRRDPTLITEWMMGTGEAMMFPHSNPMATIVYDMTANYDRFRDRPIIPYYMQGWNPAEQYSRFTSTFAKQFARGAEMAGVSISPMKMDFLIQQVGGGMAKDVLLGWDAMMGTDRPEKQIYDYPIARRFVKNLDRGSQAVNAFYKLVGDKTGDYDKAKNSYQGKIANGERGDAQRLLNNMDADQKAWTILHTMGFGTEVKRMHPMENAKERVALFNGISRQILNNNVVKEEDLDRRDLTRTRRDAKPIDLTPRNRSNLQDELLELSVATTRNAMVAVGAKGTTGLKLMDTKPIEDRIRQISPAVWDELQTRLDKKKLPDPTTAAKNWPEMKRRLLTDGESADFKDLAPKPKRRR